MELINMEVIDPAMTVKITGSFLKFFIYYIYYYMDLGLSGLILYIIYWNKSHMNKRWFVINSNRISFYTVVKTINRIGPHDKDVISVIIGSLLGDSYGCKRYIDGTRICFRQSIVHKEYLFWLYLFFNSRGYCSDLKPRVYTRLLKINSKEKKYYGYEFNTYTFRSFDWIYNMFYNNGKKRIHTNLDNYMTPLALAIWISDDGCWVKNAVRIACNSFTLKEVEYLVKIINKNFDLMSNVQNGSNNNQYSIYIQSKSIIKLRNIVSPFMHNSMLYKLGL